MRWRNARRSSPIGETQTRAGTPAISQQRERVPKALSHPTLCLPSQLNYFRILRLAASIGGALHSRPWGEFVVHPSYDHAHAGAGDDPTRSIRTIIGGCSRCWGRRHYWHRTRTRSVRHTCLGTHRRSRCERDSLFPSVTSSLAPPLAVTRLAQRWRTKNIRNSIRRCFKHDCAGRILLSGRTEEDRSGCRSDTHRCLHVGTRSTDGDNAKPPV